MRTNRLHEIACQTVASRRVNVQNTQTWIKPQCGSSEPSFGLKDGINVIQDGIRWVRSQSGRSRKRRNACSETKPMIGNSGEIILWKIYWQRTPC